MEELENVVLDGMTADNREDTQADISETIEDDASKEDKENETSDVTEGEPKKKKKKPQKPSLGGGLISITSATFAFLSGTVNILSKPIVATVILLGLLFGIVLLLGMGMPIMMVIGALAEYVPIISAILLIIFIVVVYSIPLLTYLIFVCAELMPVAWSVLGFVTALVAMIKNKRVRRNEELSPMHGKARTGYAIALTGLIINILAFCIFLVIAVVVIAAVTAGGVSSIVNIASQNGIFPS